MIVTLGVLRHGRATGQAPGALLTPEGEAYVARLGRLLASEPWRPVAAFSSPYVRARDTARIVLGELASDLAPWELPELEPDTPPDRALDALLASGLPAGPTLVVAHMPLVARLAQEIADEVPDFSPGTFAEISFDTRTRRGWLARVIGADAF